MEFISRMITSILDLLVRPFGPERHTLGLVWLSLLSGVGMALVFRATTSPRRIRAAKDRFRSYIYEMRIYQDSLRAVLIAFFQSLRSNVLYVWSILPPLLILVIPMIVIIAQLDERYGAAHLNIGDVSVVTIRLAPGSDPYDTEVSLASGPGARVDAGPVRIAGANEISWRVRIDEPGTHEATISIDGAPYALLLVAESGYRMIGRTRGAKALEAFIHPGMPPIPGDSGIERVRVDYRRASYPLLFWRVHWLLIFLVYTLVGAVAIKLAVGFEI
jgi:hypothetical protein